MGIVGLCRNEGQEARADFARTFAGYGDFSLSDTLNERDHGEIIKQVLGTPFRLWGVNTPFAARALYALAWMFGRLPVSMANALGRFVGWLWRQTDAREARIARRNMALIAPAASDATHETLTRDILRTTGQQFLETLRFWTHPPERNLRALKVDPADKQRFLDAIARGRGVIVSAPHYGNWELLNQWLADTTDLAILYRPPESEVGEAFLRLVRHSTRHEVHQVRAGGAGLRTLIRTLQSGGVVGILPDQQPGDLRDGVFAPFFGRPALTMTLLNRLAHKTGAEVLHAWCERATDGRHFTLHVEAADPAVSDADDAVAASALNADIEHIASRDPKQYQWTYKRFTMTPPGTVPPNPYRDLETH